MVIVHSEVNEKATSEKLDLGKKVEKGTGEKRKGKGSRKGGVKIVRRERPPNSEVQPALDVHVGEKRDGAPMEVDEQEAEAAKKAKRMGEIVHEVDAGLSEQPYGNQ